MDSFSSLWRRPARRLAQPRDLEIPRVSPHIFCSFYMCTEHKNTTRASEYLGPKPLVPPHNFLSSWEGRKDLGSGLFPIIGHTSHRHCQEKGKSQNVSVKSMVVISSPSHLSARLPSPGSYYQGLHAGYNYWSMSSKSFTLDKSGLLWPLPVHVDEFPVVPHSSEVYASHNCWYCFITNNPEQELILLSGELQVSWSDSCPGVLLSYMATILAPWTKQQCILVEC